MTNLQEYLTSQYPSDIRDIEEVETLLVSVTDVYRLDFHQEKAWPYQILATKDTDFPDIPSQSTTAMILNALLRFGGYFESADTTPDHVKRNVFAIEAAKKSFIKPPPAPAVQDDSLGAVVRRAGLLLSRLVGGSTETIQTNSTTYGKDDIFTLAWIAEVASSDWKSVYGDNETVKEALAAWTNIADRVGAKVLEKAQIWAKSDGKDFMSLLNPSDLDIKPQVQPHAFTVLRLVQALQRLCLASGGEAVQTSFQAAFRFFEKLLHEQLSFSSIPDSRFDPAELMFCLEGMLICQQSTVDRTVFDRVLSVLSDAQSKSAYWRPVKPFLTTQKGYALFPVSVEIANSLMRACAIFDGNSLQDTYGSRCVGLLRRYWQWLRARQVRVKKDDVERIGWHSEHVNAPEVIHLWETSQVMEFLLSFRNTLHRHIARTTLVLSRFTQSSPKKVPWSEITESHEPVDPVTGVGEDSKLSIYRRIKDDFIDPRGKPGGDQNFSILLYGPPGTGKTTIANGIANALNRRFITITVSDFLASGDAQLEARAKDIFTVLMAQPECVVLFDEIDHFLLDRDSERYGDQDTVFQFMTPGMLTKLNDLRRKERALFVVATNYEDRIDAAIKRTGRIDRNYLVLPPDAEKRKQFIRQWIGETPLRGKNEERLFDTDVGEQDWPRLKRHSLFLGFSDIEGAVKEVRSRNVRNVDLLAKALESRARTTSLEAYQSRFTGDENTPLPVRETPIREFLCLLALYCEAEGGQLAPGTPANTEKPFELVEISPSVESVVRKFLGVVSDKISGGQGAQGVVKNFAPELNERAVRAVAWVLEKCNQVNA